MIPVSEELRTTVLEATRAREAADITEGRVVVFCGCAFPRGAIIPTHPDEAMLFAMDALHRIINMPTGAELAAYIEAGYTSRGVIMQMAARAVAKVFGVEHTALLGKYIAHYWMPAWDLAR